MADSAFLSRLPVRGAVFQSSGEADAFKVPLLDHEGKINQTLISNSATIYEAANTTARLALTAATPGDFCTQADNNSIYFLKIAAPTQESSWIRLSTVQDSEQDFDSPNFTGVPTAPTASLGTNSTQLATTAFVKNLAGSEIPEVNTGAGSPGESIKFAREDHIHPTDISRAPLNSPEFTGQPKAPTPDYTESTQNRLATIGFVKQQSIDGFVPARGNVNLNNYRIVSLGMPISDRDAATKGYVDALQGGLTIREPVRVATTGLVGNINLNGSVTTIDGVTLANGDRVLVKNQTNGAQNGIYVVNLNGPWQRSADADSSIEMRNGVYMFVTEGTINANSAWALITSGNIVLNTTPLTFIFYTRQDVDTVQAGLGLLRETNTLVIDPAVVATVSLVATKQNTLVSGTNIKTLNDQSLLGSGNIALTKSSVGLANVDNTSDLNKPISTAAQTALDGKQVTLVSGTNIKTLNDQSLLGSGNITLTKSSVGLANVDNTSDLNKPISTATQTQLDLKVPTSRTISPGTGLTGGGDLSANRTLAVSYGTTAGTACQGNDGRIAGIESDSISTTACTIIANAGGFQFIGGDPSLGTIDTSDDGGAILTYSNGGSIDTSQNGGAISTRGTGSIEFGNIGTRTTLTGTATQNRDIDLPDRDGTLVLTNSVLNLPIPKIKLITNQGEGAVSIPSLDVNTLETGALIDMLKRIPLVTVTDITKEQLESGRIFLECVIFNGDKSRAPSPWYGNTTGFTGLWNTTWIHPWPQNFHTRTGAHNYLKDLSGDVLEIKMVRPNHFPVTGWGQTIPIYQFMHGRFALKNINYRKGIINNGNINEIIDTAELFCPLDFNRGRSIGNRYAYSGRFAPFRFACRYIYWNPEANGGLGEIISGPLSRTIRVWYQPFPFNLDHVLSSTYGKPVASLNPNYLDSPEMNCWLE